MIAVIFLIVTLFFIFPCLSFRRQQAINSFLNAEKLKLEAELERIDLDIKHSELTGEKITIDTCGFIKPLADSIALRTICSDANVELIHEGKKIPTMKQVVEALKNEPRPSP
jgi:hypothetical protein